MNPPAATPARITLPRTPAALEAGRAGIDLGLVEDNLNLAHEQRILQHNRALTLMVELRRQFEQTGNHADDARATASKK
jgi:hypothetical protein